MDRRRQRRITLAAIAHVGLALTLFLRVFYSYRAGIYLPVPLVQPFELFWSTIRGHPAPRLHDPMDLDFLDAAFRRWQVSGPLRVALPPAYSNHPFANVVYMQSVVTHPEALMFDGDFPLPNLEVGEHPVGSSVVPYKFENRGSNATLLTPIEGSLWPFGYTAWSDLYVD